MMKRYVVDTQCLVWFLSRDRRLPKSARRAFDAAQEGAAQILAPSICLVECLFLFQRQRIAVAVMDMLLNLTEAPDAPIVVVSLDMATVRAVQDFGPAVIPELADRIIAATARALGLPLLTTDQSIIASGLVQVID